MIYELSLLAKDSLGEKGKASMDSLVKDTLAEFSGEILVSDDWGVKNLAQATLAGETRGHYLYYIYKSNTQANTELTRKFGINESLIRHMIVKKGEDRHQDKFLKGYKSPFSKAFNGSVVDEDEENGGETDRKRFSRAKDCWFEARNIRADWKDPNTYVWMLNDFGKISPARISNVSRKHQRFAEAEIKRARNMGVVSHLSNAVIH
jgi:small subunit ribosomal protein S6